MFIAPADATRGEDEWRPFVDVPSVRPPGRAGRPGRDLPVVVPTQFVLEDDTVWLHLVRANPMFAALAENPRVLLSVADDWAFIPSSWKVIGDEDPAPRDPDHLLRRRAADRHGDGARRAHGAGQRGGHPAAPAGHVPTRRRRGRPGEAHAAQAARESSGSPSTSSRCRPSSSTAATSTSHTAGPWWNA